MNCAASCGINVAQHRLFESDGRQFFGSVRFDRQNGRKMHMVTVSGLLETTHRIPNLDYSDLLKLTDYLTHDKEQLLEMIRRMCFNSFAHNWDDHSKNFTFLYDDIAEKWKLSPAYDLTYSFSFGGERATTVNGNGRMPSDEDIYAVCKPYDFSENQIGEIISGIKKKTREI